MDQGIPKRVYIVSAWSVALEVCHADLNRHISIYYVHEIRPFCKPRSIITKTDIVSTIRFRIVQDLFKIVYIYIAWSTTFELSSIDIKSDFCFSAIWRVSSGFAGGWGRVREEMDHCDGPSWRPSNNCPCCERNSSITKTDYASEIRFNIVQDTPHKVYIVPAWSVTYELCYIDIKMHIKIKIFNEIPPFSKPRSSVTKINHASEIRFSIVEDYLHRVYIVPTWSVTYE